MPNKETSDHLPACASCELPVSERVCYSENGKGAKGCPSLTRKSVLAEARKLYQDERIKHFAHMASAQEASGYANRDQHPYVMQPSKTPTTVLAVKDRVTGHNPLAAVYQSESYYRKIRCPDVASPGITGKHE